MNDLKINLCIRTASVVKAHYFALSALDLSVLKNSNPYRTSRCQQVSTAEHSTAMSERRRRQHYIRLVLTCSFNSPCTCLIINTLFNALEPIISGFSGNDCLKQLLQPVRGI